MSDYLREILIAVVVAVAAGVVGWIGRTYLWRRKLQRRQRFFGLPENSECSMVVNRDAGTGEWAVARNDVLALLELSAVVDECGAHADLVAHDAATQSFGDRTEFCIGGPVANRRMAQHLQSLLPGVRVNTDSAPGPERGAFVVGTETHRLEAGVAEHVLLARLTAGQNGADIRPVFLCSGQRTVANQAATRYLTRHANRLARKYGQSGNFCLLLRVINSQAYGPDVVELVGDVTRAATAPAPGARKGKGTTSG